MMIEQPKSRIEEGEERYRKFWEEFSNDTGNYISIRRKFIDFSRSSGEIITDNELRAVFLGVKPSALLEFGNYENINFKKYGLKKTGNFVYNEELVNITIKNNKDVFYDIKNADSFFKKLAEDFSKELSFEYRRIEDARTGLVLGFPRISSEDFSNPVIDNKKSIAISVGNIVWSSSSESDQTEDYKFKKILEESFEIANSVD